MDLKAFVRGEVPFIGDRGFAGIAQRGSAKPLIAAVEGFAVAGGLEVALACDLIVAGGSAELRLPGGEGAPPGPRGGPPGAPRGGGAGGGGGVGAVGGPPPP